MGYNKVNYGLAVLKMFMCFEVVLIHFWNDTDYSSMLTPFMLLRNFAVPTFMLISFILGEKLFERMDPTSIKRRIWRLFWPQLGMAVIYWSFYNLLYICTRVGNVCSIKALLWQIATGTSEGLNPTMWYTTVLIFLTILFWIIWYLFKGNKGIVIMCILLVSSLILQYTGVNFILFNNLRYELKYPFGRCIEMMPYAVIGFLIMYYKVYERLEKDRYRILLGALVLTGVLFFSFRRMPNITKINGFGYAGIYLIAMAVLITTIAYYFPFQKFPQIIQNLIVVLTKYTLGIYCMHRLVGKCMILVFERMGIEVGTFAMCICIYILCYGFSALISHIPTKMAKHLVE